MGENFAKAFEIMYLDRDGERRFAHTTSWGVSTRVIGAVVMAHGDDKGLRLPPAIAPVQAVVLAVKQEAIDACRRLVDELVSRGVRAKLDDRTDQSFGRRAVDYELKGVPVRIEIGPRDLAEGKAVLVRRDVEGKQSVSLSELAGRVPALLDEIATALRGQALERREQMTQDVAAIDAIDGPGFYRIEWEAMGREDGEAKLRERAYTVRCLVTENGEVPSPRQEDGLIAYVAKAY